MTLKKIISRMKQYRPQFADEFEQMIGPTLTEIGKGGCFREVFHIEGTRAVIKFPMQDETGNYSVIHSRREIRRIKQVMRSKKYKHIQRYVPKMYYSDYKNGILIMQFLHDVGDAPEDAQDIIGKMLEDTFCCISKDSDVNKINMGYDGRGQIKVLDWGCV